MLVPKLLEIRASSKLLYVDPLHVVLSVPHLAIPEQNALQQYASVNCIQKHIVFFRGCSVYKFESEVTALPFKHGLTLKETRQEARLCSFQQIPLSQRIFINTPQTTTNTDSPLTKSHPSSSTHITSSSTPLFPSSSTITSSTSLTHLVVNSVPVNNKFFLLYPNLPTSIPSISNLIPLSTSYSGIKHQASLLCFPSKTFYKNYYLFNH